MSSSAAKTAGHGSATNIINRRGERRRSRRFAPLFPQEVRPTEDLLRKVSEQWVLQALLGNLQRARGQGVAFWTPKNGPRPERLPTGPERSFLLSLLVPSSFAAISIRFPFASFLSGPFCQFADSVGFFNFFPIARHRRATVQYKVRLVHVHASLTVHVLIPPNCYGISDRSLAEPTILLIQLYLLMHFVNG